MNEIISLPADWAQVLKEEIAEPHFSTLLNTLQQLYRSATVYPPASQVFRAFSLSTFQTTRVVILGQDPYHQAGQAHGLCFSVNAGIRVPPSLRNIYKELASDLKEFQIPPSGDLSSWAKQGVLLLNTILTVKAGEPGSHKALGWQKFTDAVIHALSLHKEHLVFMLWGNHAKEKLPLIDAKKHLVLTAAHPSPLARTAFAGCRHFSQANAWLREKGLPEINWQI